MNNLSLDTIYDNLTEEEKSVLSKIQQKTSELLQQMKESRFSDIENIDTNTPDFSSKHPDLIHPKNLTKSPHEIIITVRGEVSEIDDKGNINQVKDVVEKYYHIPVKGQDDYKAHLDKFFDTFHKSIESTCQELNSFKQES